MATYKPAAHIADIRGHVQNAVYSKNRLGNYIKLRKAPLDRRTALQLTQRALMFDAVAYWRDTISDANRILWNNLGLLTTWYNKSGIAYHPSGFNLFNRMFIFTQSSGTAATYVAPNVAASAAPTFTFSSATNGTLDHTIVSDAGWCTAKTGYVRFITTDGYAPSIFYPAWPTRTPGWIPINVIAGSFPMLWAQTTPCNVGDHVSFAAQAYYQSGAGLTVTWPEIALVTVT
jgi:hypothetical protein